MHNPKPLKPRDPQLATQAPANPQLSASMSRDMLKFLGIAVLIGIVISKWSLFVSIFSDILLWIYSLLAGLPGAFGWSIILFTILIRIVTWPLNARQMKSMKALQDLQGSKEWKAIQKKYEKEPEKKQSEQLRLQSEAGISPLGGCLPLLIQMPVLIAVYQSVSTALALTPLAMLNLSRSAADFLNISSLIPLNSKFLWFDLGRPEGILIPGFDISFLPNGIPLLAVVVALTTYVQTKLTMPSNPDPNDQAAAMSRSMTVTMPLMLGFFALSFPSGVAIYIFMGNVLAIVQSAMLGNVNWRNLLPGGNKQPARK